MDSLVFKTKSQNATSKNGKRWNHSSCVVSDSRRNRDSIAAEKIAESKKLGDLLNLDKNWQLYLTQIQILAWQTKQY